MRVIRTALALAALVMTGVGCVPPDPGPPVVAVTVSLVGPVDEPTGVLVAATPSGFAGAGPYVVSFGVADESLGTDVLTGTALPVVVPLSGFQIATTDDGGRSVQVRAEATFERGGAAATGTVTKLLCWGSCSR